MIFRQLFDGVSGTYSYLLASRSVGEALIIDPVLEKVERYLQLIGELARVNDKCIVFYCAFGERSAMAVQDAGMLSALHVEGGLDAWKKAQGPLVR